jgi:hypothetical protein
MGGTVPVARHAAGRLAGRGAIMAAKYAVISLEIRQRRRNI